jgi:hypothetical protein
MIFEKMAMGKVVLESHGAAAVTPIGETVCETCHWWQPWNSGGPAGKRLGECRRQSPKLVDTGEQMKTKWPATNSADWCGNWKLNLRHA